MRVKGVHDSGGMKDQKPKQKHGPQPSRPPVVHLLGRDADPGGDKSRTREIGPEQMPGNPRRHKAGDKGKKKKVVDAEHHRRNREQIRTDPINLSTVPHRPDPELLVGRVLAKVKADAQIARVSKKTVRTLPVIGLAATLGSSRSST